MKNSTMSKIIYSCFICSFMLLLGFSIPYFLPSQKMHNLFITEQPMLSTITNEIRARGKLEVTDLLKIGSKISGIILKMHHEEGDYVKKGEVLANVDDGKDNTEVLQSAAQLKQAKANLAYQTSYHARQQVLFENGYLSRDDFEKIERDYKVAQAVVEEKKAINQQVTLLFNSKTITAPDNGFILTKNSSLGETVTNASPATVIYTIAKNSSMEAQLEINESDIHHVAVGTPVSLSFDALPNKVITGTITSIRNSPIKSGETTSYIATVPVDNTEKLFRLGMSTNAHILLSSTDNVLIIPQYAFNISTPMVKHIAKQLKYSVHSINDKTKQKNNGCKNIKYLWTYHDHAFYEKTVTIGIQNAVSAQILSGIDPETAVVVDVMQPKEDD